MRGRSKALLGQTGRYRSKRTQKKAADDRKAKFIAAALGVGLVFVGWGVFNTRAPATHALTHCRVDGVIPSHTVLLIDATDKLPSVVLSRLRSAVERLEDRMGVYDKITILTVEGGDASSPVQELFSVCNPGRGKDVSWLTDNPEWAEEDWQADFSGPLEAQLAALGALKQANSTPLLEALFLVGQRSDFQTSDAGAGVGRRELIVVSDFLHHTAEHSHYRGAAPFGDAMSSAYLRSMMPRLDGVELDTVFVPRPEVASLQNTAHRAFWRDYFRMAGTSADAFEG